MAARSWMQWLVPSDKRVGESFVNLGDLIGRSATQLSSLVAGETTLERASSEMKSLEHKGDEITRELYASIRRSLVHPFPPEDIHRLAFELDEVIDAIEGTCGRLVIYGIGAYPERFREAVSLLMKSCQIVTSMTSHLARRTTSDDQTRLDDLVRTASDLEEQVDRIVRDEFKRLFDEADDWRTALSWRDIYGRLEQAVDHSYRAVCRMHEVMTVNA